MATRSPNFPFQFFNLFGDPAAGGSLYTYIAGTLVPKVTYTNKTASVANSNPIVLDANGFPPESIYLVTGEAYRFILKDSSGNVIRDEDNIQGGFSVDFLRVETRQDLRDLTYTDFLDAIICVPGPWEEGGSNNRLYYFDPDNTDADDDDLILTPSSGPTEGRWRTFTKRDLVTVETLDVTATTSVDLSVYTGDLVIFCNGVDDLGLSFSNSLPAGSRLVVYNVSGKSVTITGISDLNGFVLRGHSSVTAAANTTPVMEAKPEGEQRFEVDIRTINSEFLLELINNAFRQVSGQYRGVDLTDKPLRFALDSSNFVMSTTTETNFVSNDFDFDSIVFSVDLFSGKTFIAFPTGFGFSLLNSWLDTGRLLQNRFGKYTSMQHAMSGNLLDVIGHGYYLKKPSTSSFSLLDQDIGRSDVRRNAIIEQSTGDLIFTGESPTPGQPSYILKYSRLPGLGYSATPSAIQVWDGSLNLGAIAIVQHPETGRILIGLGYTSAGTSRVVWSDDKGATWPAGNVATLTGNMQQMVVLRSGRILALLETGSSNTTPYYSDNAGATWTAGTQTTDGAATLAGRPLEDSSGNIFVGCQTGEVLRSTNSGLNFSLRGDIGISAGHVNAIIEFKSAAYTDRLLAACGGTSRGLVESFDGGLSWQDVGGTGVSSKTERILPLIGDEIFVSREYFNGSVYVVEIWKTDNISADFTLYATYNQNKRHGDLIQSPFDGTIFLSLGSNGDGTPVVLSIETEELIATGNGTPIRIRAKDGVFDVTISEVQYNAGNTVLFGPPTFSLNSHALSFPPVSSAIAPSEASRGQVFANVNAGGNYYFIDNDGTAKPLSSSGTTAPLRAMSEIGTLTESTSGSFNFPLNNAYAMQFVARDTGLVSAIEFIVGPNATTANTQMEIGIYTVGLVLIGKLAFTLPSGSVGLIQINFASAGVSLVRGEVYYFAHSNGSGVIVEIARSFTTSTNYGYFSGSLTLPTNFPTANATNRNWWTGIL